MPIMNQHEKIIFINELFDKVKMDIINNIDKIPENWDGIELRWLIRDHMDMIVSNCNEDKRDRRYKNYHNKVIVNNL
jgi:hypothetical protein